MKIWRRAFVSVSCVRISFVEYIYRMIYGCKRETKRLESQHIETVKAFSILILFLSVIIPAHSCLDIH